MTMRLQSGVQISSSNIVLISFFIMATQILSFYRKRTSAFKMGVNCLNPTFTPKKFFHRNSGLFTRVRFCKLLIFNICFVSRRNICVL